MKSLVIADGREILISDEDFHYVAQFRWHGTHYIQRMIKRKTSRLHHEIALRMGIKAQDVDHKDRNTLNNQRENLRRATKNQNNSNTSKRSGTTSEHKGVSYCNTTQKWRVQIQANKYRINGGFFDTEKEAAIAYNFLAIRLHGEFAVLNEVD